MAQWSPPISAPASADVLFFTDIQRRAVKKRKDCLWRDSRKECVFSLVPVGRIKCFAGRMRPAGLTLPSPGVGVAYRLLSLYNYFYGEGSR